MSRIIEQLRRFNRKERFFLVGWALGRESFQLGDDFRDAVNRELNTSIPPDAFVAMDYHLDWLFASLYLAAADQPVGPPYSRDDCITGSQEDVDLLIAYDADGICHVVLLEAKARTGWTNKQFTSKVRRLSAIFERAAALGVPVQPHFALASPTRPRGLRIAECPPWMAPGGQVPWLPLPSPAASELHKVTRCDAAGKATKESWTHWRLDRG